MRSALATITFDNAAPSGTIPVISGIPTITGTAQEGQVLTANPASRTGDPTPTRSWVWKSGGTTVGTNQATYQLQASDVGNTITATQTETNVNGSDSETSAATATVTAAPAQPVISGLPTITGTVQENQILTANPASVTGTAPITRTLQWKSSGTNVGVDSTSYTLQASDVGNTITVTQTETNSEGSDSATSVQTVTVTAAGSGVVPTILGETFVGSGEGGPARLTITGGYAGNDVLDFYGVTGTEPITVSASELINGSGGTNTIEFFNIPNFTFELGDFEPTGLTSASDNTTRIAYLVTERNNGGVSQVAIPNDAIVGLDFTAPSPPAPASDLKGAKVVLSFAEPIYGVAAGATVTVTGVTGGSATIESIQGFGTDTLVIQLSGNLIQFGDSPLLNYSGGDWRDANGEALADIVNLAITNNASNGFVEQGVVVTRDDELIASAPLGGATYRSGLYFGSLISTGETSRRVLWSMDANNMAAYANYTTKDGVVGLYAAAEGDLSGSSFEQQPIATGTRYHILWAFWLTGANLRSVAYMFDTSAPGWVPAHDETVANASDFLNFGTDPMRIFNRSDTTAHEFLGTVWRQSLWASTNQTAIADLTQASVRDAFATGTSIADPATTLAAYSSSTLLWELEGSALDYNASPVYQPGIVTLTPSEATVFTDV